MALTASSLVRSSLGNQTKIAGYLSFDSSYPTGGESITAQALGLARITDFEIKADTQGYFFDRTIPASQASVTVLVYTPSGGGTAAAQTFTAATTAGPLNLATPVFSGTGLTAAGQVITTTDNQTMTLNQCAGLWLISATGATPPNLILSNTAVTGAPAVLTVQGAASTDAGAYKIVKTLITGTNGTSSVSSSAAAEVANGTNLSTLTPVYFEAVGV